MVPKNIYTKKIHFSLPILYCVVVYQNVSKTKNWHINQSYRLNDFITLHNIQHASGNPPLKGPTLGSADKYTIYFASVSLAG